VTAVGGGLTTSAHPRPASATPPYVPAQIAYAVTVAANELPLFW
jgi:hypothetical protein